MFPSSRRQFLRQATSVAAAWSAHTIASRFLPAYAATTDPVTRVWVDTRRTIAPLERNVFGSFLEHLGRAIYEGVYDPKSKFADANGYRKDVLEEVRKLEVPIIRYPGGNFVSGYHWLDGVGPKEDRPKILDKAWNTLETNQFGTNEFMAWCKLVGAQPLMGLNLGTGTPEQAAALLEYCNVESGTKWSDLRRKHGIAEPHRVKHWCLGNEMDGPWQIGHMTANEYGIKATDTARQMRYVDQDPGLQLIACGSSNPFMSTYLEWDRVVLEQCYEYVNGLSLHRYYGNNSQDSGGDSAKYVALNILMDRQIKESLAVCDLVQGLKRSRKPLWLSFDEWNVWYRERSGGAVNGAGKQAPHLLEEVYNFEDALLVGGLLNTLVRNADRVKIACLAQLINVIAPIMTNAEGILRQTIYYPYSWALQYARGRVLNLMVESPTYDVPEIEQVPYLDIAGTIDPGDGKRTLFVLNRDLSKSRAIEINWEDKTPGKVITALVLTGSDLKAVNSFDAPQRVVPQALDKPVGSSSSTRFEVPARSYAVIQWGA